MGRAYFKHSGLLLDIPVPESITVASDVSGSHYRLGMGYLANNGAYGIYGDVHHPDPHGTEYTVVGELRAAYLALGHVRSLTAAPVTLLCDSQHAVRLMHGWKAGEQDFPRGYNTNRKRSTLQTFAHLLATDERITIEWTLRARHPLNMAANEFASLAHATQWGRLPLQEAIHAVQIISRRTLERL